MFLCLNTFTAGVHHGLLRAVLAMWRGPCSGLPGDQPLREELCSSTSSTPTPGTYLASSCALTASLPQRDSRDGEVLLSDSGKLTCKGPAAHLALRRQTGFYNLHLRTKPQPLAAVGGFIPRKKKSPLVAVCMWHLPG